jgi:hypothetical protein
MRCRIRLLLNLPSTLRQDAATVCTTSDAAGPAGRSAGGCARRRAARRPACSLCARAGACRIGNVVVDGEAAVRKPALARPAALVVAALLLSGCGILGGSDSADASVSVFDIKPGLCFNPPGTVKSELSKLTSVPCDKPHTQESYASIPYTNKDGSEVSAYPGDAALKLFADGACAQQYTGYVGKDYLDSSYFFTYLLPSARGWEQQKDRNVLCFVTTTGQQLTASVKNSKR